MEAGKINQRPNRNRWLSISDSGSDYQPESDSTDEERNENSSPKRKSDKK